MRRRPIVIPIHTAGNPNFGDKRCLIFCGDGLAIVHGVKRRRPRAFRLPVVVGGEDVANVVHLERGGRWWIGGRDRDLHTHGLWIVDFVGFGFSSGGKGM